MPCLQLATVFGRNDVLADVVLDHPSISRQHAAICFEAGTGRCLVIDLGSAHGTFLEGKQLQKVSYNRVNSREYSLLGWGGGKGVGW